MEASETLSQNVSFLLKSLFMDICDISEESDISSMVIFFFTFLSSMTIYDKVTRSKCQFKIPWFEILNNYCKHHWARIPTMVHPYCMKQLGCMSKTTIFVIISTSLQIFSFYLQNVKLKFFRQAVQEFTQLLVLTHDYILNQHDQR